MQSPSAHTLVLSGTASREQGALSDITRLLASGSPPAAIAAGIRHILLRQLDLDYDPGPAGTARMLTWLLEHRPGPFTAVVAALTGQHVTIDSPGLGRRTRLTGAQAIDLAVLDIDGLTCWTRPGQMLYGTRVAADTSLTVIPSRMRPGELARIQAGTPCGTVIPGLVRARRHARPGGTVPVYSGAVLQRPAGQPFGFAAEQLRAAFITAVSY
jgi:hypothetical protein